MVAEAVRSDEARDPPADDDDVTFLDHGFSRLLQRTGATRLRPAILAGYASTITIRVRQTRSAREQAPEVGKGVARDSAGRRVRLAVARDEQGDQKADSH